MTSCDRDERPALAEEASRATRTSTSAASASRAAAVERTAASAARARCSRGRRRRAATRAALLPTARSRGIRARAAATIDRREPDAAARVTREADPQHDVAEIERVADQRERTGRDQRAEPVAARPRDRADVVHAPQPDQLRRRAISDRRRPARSGRRAAPAPTRQQREWRSGERQRERGALAEQPAAESGRASGSHGIDRSWIGQFDSVPALI